ncbi:MAG: tetrahydromethanopterin S-methyltransferase subunit A [Thermoproteota archaeon]|nr:tetrahydromethanopterin S-methyltransferase subunit A [Thermoproteota archaeon]
MQRLVGELTDLNIKFQLEQAAGLVCKVIYPIPVSSFSGKGTEVAICTLSSIDLLKKISSDAIMDKLLIVGRLFSENKGIDHLIQFCTMSSTMKYLILCGKDTNGHYPADALMNLMQFGLDEHNKIIGTKAPYPFIKCHPNLVNKFREQIKLIDLRECYNLDKIIESVIDLT